MLPQRTLDLIKKHEGCRLCEYVDTEGYATIGWGHKVLPGESFPKGLTQAEADALLVSDADQKQIDAMNILACYKQLNEVRQAVIIDMVFNLGMSGFSKFKRLIAALNASDFQTAANEMRNSAWYNQVKTRAVEDCSLMLRGTWI